MYADGYTYLGGKICNGVLELTSGVYGDDDFPGSERHYKFTREETAKLFSIVSVEEFERLSTSVNAMEEFLDTHGIRYESCSI